ncbi:hypothetical protein A359_03660 [secondary endosymbiont of Ctenarytaina eucalypti]|uniref:Uncharacterized protein n=1 Tax=secondary endosymbiont of Ctenarytaina eucalypti TaxID=1199245 RepID=J3VS03_9ENTR|nr:hypothetical protein A359_03660 [secondary endosymbiont of Ctenarytaina eucalypti]
MLTTCNLIQHDDYRNSNLQIIVFGNYKTIKKRFESAHTLRE